MNFPFHGWLLCSLFCVSLLGCGAVPTRAQDPSRYTLVASGSVPAVSVPALIECLTDGFQGVNAGNTAFSVQQTKLAQSSRIEVYVSRVNLAVSADVFDDGRTELRLAPDPFGMFTKEPSIYRSCVAVNQK